MSKRPTGLPPVPESVQAVGPDVIAWLWSAADAARGAGRSATVAKALGVAAATLEQELVSSGDDTDAEE